MAIVKRKDTKEEEKRRVMALNSIIDLLVPSQETLCIARRSDVFCEINFQDIAVHYFTLSPSLIHSLSHSGYQGPS
ncbi:hypothetical protein E2C01_067162 [Portunus trituberculatus]|uniref:Uncharacterized protein n=1 Tax=Portunus trituberculatus TaxID=210409 RepID=A0A5B7HVV0_PORTR|nr:hypothetical protein [Portunus trituberculatus]